MCFTEKFGEKHIRELTPTEVAQLVFQTAKSIRHKGLMLNERYLHHYFSHLLQQKWNMLNLTGDHPAILLHPEWPTYKKQTGLQFGQYSKMNGKYQPDLEGTAGFVDFAIGDYNKPEIGIEFSLKYGWSNEEMVYDFLKLLDGKNPFKMAISLNINFRRYSLVRGAGLTDLESHMNRALDEAVHRLKNGICIDERKLLFTITEIAKNNTRRHWVCNEMHGKFEKTTL
jgi:hypothetical protein